MDYASTGDKVFLTRDGRSTYALVYPPPFLDFADRPDLPVKASLDAQARTRGFDLKVTGYNLLAAGEDTAQAPSVLAETALGALGALVVLVFVFASFLALVPLIIAAVSIVTTFLVVLGLTYLTDVSFIVQFLIALVGLGVAIDYSLLLVNRWREERDHGRENADAVLVAMQTAGRAVVSSAGTVAISLIALLVIPVPFLRSMGLGGMLIPLVSTFVVLTLLPPCSAASALASTGRGSATRRRLLGRGAPGPGWWCGIAGWPPVPPWRSSAHSSCRCSVVPLFSLQIGAARTESLARSGPAYQALQTLRQGGVPTGIVTPVEVLIRDGGDPAKVVAAARGVSGVASAFAPDNPVWRKGDSAMVNVIPTAETVDSKGSKVAERIGAAVNDLPGVVGEAGAGPVVLDYIDAVYGAFPLVLGLIVLVTFVLLARAFRSIVLPLKAVILNILSVSATFGGMVLFWQLGHGSDEIFNVQSTGAITFWLPLLVFAFLFGLSMDYEVFILSRMREEYDRTGSTSAAVVEGIGRTGRLVTSAALILSSPLSPSRLHRERISRS
ncbi:MAG: MMPL family transporter [Frankiaceae bacterium]